MCMGMGKAGIPWVPWDSHGNGNKISYGMGMGMNCMGMGIKMGGQMIFGKCLTLP